MIYFESERIYLRKLNIEDYKLLLELDSDSEVMKYLTDGRPSTKEDAQDAVKRVLKVYEQTASQFGLWPAYLKHNHEFIGWFLFKPDKDDPLNLEVIEVGYRLKRSYWSKGYATEMSRALIEYGFMKLGIKEAYATTMEDNLASQKVMIKLGMKFKKNYIESLFPGKNKSAVRYYTTKEIWSRDNTSLQ